MVRLRRGSARSSSRSTRRPADRSSQHVLTDSAPARADRRGGASSSTSTSSSACRPSSSASGCSTRRPAATTADSRSRRFPEPAARSPPADVAPGRHRRDPLHLRHDRPVEGRHVPAGPVLLVGAQHRGDARRADERRRALHVPAALPHERAERVHPGAEPRRGVRRRASASRRRVSGTACSPRTRP